ncbi:MAG: hypothetical protein ACR2O2_03755 [Ruegeria sp.]
MSHDLGIAIFEMLRRARIAAMRKLQRGVGAYVNGGSGRKSETDRTR